MHRNELADTKITNSAIHPSQLDNNKKYTHKNYEKHRKSVWQYEKAFTTQNMMHLKFRGPEDPDF